MDNYLEHKKKYSHFHDLHFWYKEGNRARAGWVESAIQCSGHQVRLLLEYHDSTSSRLLCRLAVILDETQLELIRGSHGANPFKLLNKNTLSITDCIRGADQRRR